MVKDYQTALADYREARQQLRAAWEKVFEGLRIMRKLHKLVVGMKMLPVKVNGISYVISVAGKRTVVYRRKGRKPMRRVKDWLEIKMVLAEAQRKLDDK